MGDFNIQQPTSNNQHPSWEWRLCLWLLAWGMFCAGLPVLGDGAVEAGCREWAAKTEKELGDGFIVVSDPPFVLAGDLSRAGLKRYQDHTVKAASQALGDSGDDRVAGHL